MKKVTFTLLLLGLMTASCVSKKKYIALENQLANSTSNLQKTTLEKERLEARFKKIEDRVKNYNNKINSLKDENVSLERNNLQFIDDNVTVLSKKQKEALRKTLAKVDANKLSKAKTLKDSINLAIDYKLKNSINSAGLYSYNDDDININIENTVVMISVSDKLFFNSGSYRVHKKAHPLLQKLAAVINSEPSMDVMIEGHTDSQSIKTATIKDNWDLSVKRATAIVRLLEKKHAVKSSRLIASGRGSSMPLTDNSTKKNRARNRRTRIVILPNLDKFFALLSSENSAIKS
ncbi:MAG: OmpA family protein [Polaribacter sp.]